MSKPREPECRTCRVLEAQVAHLQSLVDRLMADRPAVPASTTLPPQPTAAPGPSVPFQIKGEDGREYVVSPDGTLDTKENYDRAMSMLERTMAGRPSYDLDTEKPSPDEALP